jgi:hypothetical protein
MYIYLKTRQFGWQIQINWGYFSPKLLEAPKKNILPKPQQPQPQQYLQPYKLCFWKLKMAKN